MKRKLIGYDAFNKIKTESLSNVRSELEGAADLLARTLELEGLSLVSYGQQEALFESMDGTHVHANYEVKNGFVQFDQVEQLVINEESEVVASKEVISRMIDSLIESEEGKADELFAEWMGLPRTKRIFTEMKKLRVVPIRKKVGGKTKIVGYRKARWNVTPRSHESASKTAKRVRGKKVAQRKLPEGLRKFLAQRRERVKKTIGEWHVIAENVLGYMDVAENGPAVDQCQVLRHGGEVVGVRVPTAKLRNEARVLKFNWKTLNTDVVVKRNASKKISENQEFTKEIAELKRFNALSDSQAVDESIEKISTKHPEVIYLTEAELAGQIKRCLESVNATNYDDETCRFLAEGILRTAHENLVDRVSKVVKLAGAKINEQAADKYAEFKNVAESFYKRLDEGTMLEMQAFVDVYEALRQIHEMAVEEKNEIVAEETAEHLDGLLPIVRSESEMSLEVLADAAEWLYDVVEATVPEEWKTAEPVVSDNGEHPEVVKKGKASQSPADNCGHTPAAQHTSDGKEYAGAAAKELEGEGWGNIGGDGVYPEMDNPYLLKGGEYKIAGEKDVDSDTDQLAQWGDNDTWPNLQNPYSKASVTPTEAK